MMFTGLYKCQLTFTYYYTASIIEQSDPTRVGIVLRQLVVLGRMIATHCSYFICLTNLRYGKYISDDLHTHVMMVENIPVGAQVLQTLSGRFGFGLISASFVAFLREIDLEFWGI